MKSFIINLSTIESSANTATLLKTQLEQFNMPSELFEGTYGNDAVVMMENENRVMHPWGIKGPPEDFNMSTWIPNLDNLPTSRPGVKGCFYSHYRLWKKCAELNEPIIIWEDDIMLSRPYVPVEWQDVLVLAIGHPKKSWRYMPFLESPEGVPEAVDYRYSSMPGCCGYAIKPHAAKKLLHEYSRTYLPADNAINRFVVNIQIHNHLMGIAMIKKDGKTSLTRSKIWNN
jgi:GR25 family glycosyltransferase involved in LPS biosynthesis